MGVDSVISIRASKNVAVYVKGPEGADADTRVRNGEEMLLGFDSTPRPLLDWPEEMPALEWGGGQGRNRQDTIPELVRESDSPPSYSPPPPYVDDGQEDPVDGCPTPALLPPEPLTSEEEREGERRREMNNDDDYSTTGTLSEALGAAELA
ncbi:MAG: hypothetical protein AAFR83_25035 [Cyanobacteria bacterium J06629_18]